MIEEDLAASCEEACRDFEQRHPQAAADPDLPTIVNLFVDFATSDEWRSQFDSAIADLLPQLFASPCWPVSVHIETPRGETSATGELNFIDVVGAKRWAEFRLDSGRQQGHGGDVESRVRVSDFNQIRDREPGSHTMHRKELLSQMAADLRQLAEVAGQMLATTNDVLQRIADTIGPAHESLLAPEERDVFEAIGQVPGRDAAARKRVEAELGKLAGRPITKAVVSAIMDVLKERRWGIRCPTCGEPSSPSWRPNDSVQFFHTGPKGRTVTHGMTADLSTVTLVNRPRKPRQKRGK